MSNLFENRNEPFRRASRLPFLGLALVAVICLFPLLFEALIFKGPLQADFLPPYTSSWLAWGSKIAVALAMLSAMAMCAWINRAEEPSILTVMPVCIVLAGLMTVWHWICVNSLPSLAGWQETTYLAILNRCGEAPHQFRPLPYGFTRCLEWVTRDWVFSFLAYRWFFNAWFLWACYRFARLWHSPGRSLRSLAFPMLLYPISICCYYGQLTDPLSHALFVLALIFTVEDRWLMLAVSLGLGVLAKETIVIMAPAYLACWWRKGWPAFARTAGLSVVCIAAFLAARLPLGWRIGYESINGATALMLWDNLGIGQQHYTRAVPLYINYLHPTLFIFIFLPFIAVGWRRLDGRLKALCLTLAPLLFLSNLLFGWLHESRNYMPLVPLLATSAMLAILPGDHKTPKESHRGSQEEKPKGVGSG